MNILVTGGLGFLGKYVVRLLEEEGHQVVTVSSDASDLRVPESCDDLFDFTHLLFGSVDQVYHLAGYNGGILLNQKEKWRIFCSNTFMLLNVLAAARFYEVPKVLSVVASCAYPSENPILFEHEFLQGAPHPSVAGHAYAKRNLQIASSLVSEPGETQAICVCPTTLYGPGDKFDENSKVVGSMVARFVDAERRKDKVVECWGTGSPKREVLYVEDAARMIISSMEHYEDTDTPLNLGSGQEFSIRDMAEIVAEEVGYKGQIRWNKEKPDGQYRKRLSLAKMNETIPSLPLTDFRDGLKKTIEYYRSTL